MDARARHQQVMREFDRIGDLDGSARREALARLEAANPALAAEVARLLHHDARSDGFLSAPPPADLLQSRDADPVARLGTTLAGRYRLDSVLGRGGMGVVYRATQLANGREVAVKLLRAGRSTPERLRRFEREARAAAEVVHPNVAEVFDFGRAETGEPFLVTELLEGVPLSAVADQGEPMVPAAVVSICCQLLDAVAEAHGRGVVHRDLKPENVFLVTRGTTLDFVKVLDFGLVKWVAGEADRSRLTRTGNVVGTPGFIAPEVIRGGPVGPSVDLYAVGCIAWELLAGRPPFDGPPLALLEAHLRDPLPPLGLPTRWQALEQVVMRLVAKDPAERPASAEDAAKSMRATLEAPPTEKKPVSAVGWLDRITSWFRR